MLSELWYFHFMLNIHMLKLFQAMTRFPILHDYAQSWPLTDLIRLQLKYSSGRARQRRNDALAEVAKKIVSRR